MPITAKLSREFYDQFGNAVVTELVELLNQVDASSQSSLRELNELNFARFDAKLAERFAALDARFAAIDASFTAVDTKFTELKAHSDSSLERGLAATKTSLLYWYVGLSVTLFVTELLAFVGLWLTTRT